MTTPQYKGAALCYDQANVALYENACTVPNPLGNAWDYHDVQFDCTGILMASFYNNLVAGGETNACVCIFSNTGTWTYKEEYGPCNGACTQNYLCDGLTPYVAGSSTSTPANTSSGLRLDINWKTLMSIATVILFTAVG